MYLPFLVFVVAGTERAARGSWGSRTTRFTRATGATRALHQGEHGYLKHGSVMLYYRERRPGIVQGSWILCSFKSPGNIHFFSPS